MSRIGLFPSLGRGHLNPLASLGRHLVAEGHDVTVFHLSIAQTAVRSAGLKFRSIDRQENETKSSYAPRYDWPGAPKWWYTKDELSGQARRVLREAPAAIEDAGINYMLVDQNDLAAGSVAEVLGIPFVSLACAPPTFLNDELSPPHFGWPEATNMAGRIRVRAANALFRQITGSIIHTINEYRQFHKLPLLKDVNDTFSKLAIITQLPRALELPRRRMPSTLFYTAPFRDQWIDRRVRFTWNRLNGKPVIFASLSTIRNNYPHVFRMMAESCVDVNAQLVISLGAGKLLPSDFTDLPGDPIVVEYAPQRELLSKAILTINCAGLNTTFDSIAAGVPIVAIPIAEDQPGVAVRIRRAAIGEVVRFRHLTLPRLKQAVRSVLDKPQYRVSVERLRDELDRLDGVKLAANIIQSVMPI